MPAASLVPVPCRPLSVKSGGVLTPVNDKPRVFARVEPFRCKPLHFSSHTQPHSSGRGPLQGWNASRQDNRQPNPDFWGAPPEEASSTQRGSSCAIPSRQGCGKELENSWVKGMNEWVIRSLKRILQQQRSDKCESLLFYSKTERDLQRGRTWHYKTRYCTVENREAKSSHVNKTITLLKVDEEMKGKNCTIYEWFFPEIVTKWNKRIENKANLKRFTLNWW